MKHLPALSPRERQIVEAVYRLGEATVTDVRETIDRPPGYDAVRTTMRLLERKGLLCHREDGQRYVYRATVDKHDAVEDVLKNVVRTYFDGSARAAALALLQLEGDALGEGEIADLAARIADAERREEIR